MDRRLKEVGAVSYISTDAFNGNFFNYVITSSPPTYVKVGSLVSVTGATSVNCPAGHVLRENGKKLYPGAHSGVVTYMVGVFDSLSGLKGYINPNDPMFAPYNTDRPLYQPDSVYTGDGRTKNLGPSVLTLGNLASSGDIITYGQVYSTPITILDSQGPGTGSSPVLIDMRDGQLFRLNLTATGTSPVVGVSGVIDFLPASLIDGATARIIVCWTPETTGSTRTLTLGRNINPLIIGANNNVVSLTTSTTSTVCYVLTFVCDGSRVWETSRVGPMTYR